MSELVMDFGPVRGRVSWKWMRFRKRWSLVKKLCPGRQRLWELWEKRSRY